MNKTKQHRGQLTNRIKAKSKELLGYEINAVELRFMVYVQYVMCNEQRINPTRINQEEREILSKWREAKYLEGGVTGLTITKITKKFWSAICEIIFLGYVDLHE